MKKFISKPGFELIFALSFIAILCLPPMLMAQNQKDEEIKIVNGDTTVNGRNIKQLTPRERREALRDIKHINMDTSMSANVYFKRDTAGGRNRRFMFKRRVDGQRGQFNNDNNAMSTDTLGHIRRDRRIILDMPGRMEMEGRNRDMMRYERKNSQTFDYSTTDNEGVSTHVRFRVTEISNDDLKKMPHVEGGKFEISDLNVVPEFSTGKTLLMFDLPAKTPAQVKLIDSEGKVMWDEKAV